MARTYSDLLKIPGAKGFSIAGMLLRMPMSMSTISIILFIRAEYKNYSLAGIISAAYVIAVAICAPILARNVDKYGQQKIMRPAFAVTTASFLALITAIFFHAPIWTLFLFAILTGGSLGSPGALVRSRWASVIKRPQQLYEAYAFEAAIDELVFIVGPVLSTVLATTLHPSTGLILCAISVLIGSVAFLGQKATEPPIVASTHAEKAPPVIRQPAVIILILTFIGAGIMFGANDLSVVAFSEEIGLPAMAGPILAIYSTGSFIAALIYGSQTWRMPIWKLFAIGVAALVLGNTMLLFARNIFILAIVFAVSGCAIAPTMTNVNSIISRIVPHKQLTEGLTWMATSVTIGVSIGSALGGHIIDTRGSRGGFLVVVLSAWLMFIIMLAGLKWLRHEIERSHLLHN